MSRQPITLRANGSQVNVMYNADLIVDENEMIVSQLIQTNEGMSLFDNEPRVVRMTRKTLDSELKTEELPIPNAKKDNTYGQYIHIWSHYKFNDNDENDKSDKNKKDFSDNNDDNNVNNINDDYDMRENCTIEPREQEDHMVDQLANQNKEFYEWIRRANFYIADEPGCKGIDTTANDCYIAVVLQCLFNIPYFKDAILSSKNNTEYINDLKQLCYTYHLDSTQKSLNINEFTKLFCKMFAVGSEFQYCGMGDASEFTIKLIKDLNINADKYLKQKIEKLFDIFVEFTANCIQCGSKETYIETMKHLSFRSNSPGNNHLEELIRNAVDVNLPDHRCYSCQLPKDYDKYSFINLPEILVMTIDKRPGENILYPERLDLNDLIGNQFNIKTEYVLCGVILFIKKSNNFHYTTFVLHPQTNKWFYIDLTERVKEEEDYRLKSQVLNNSCARVLFYKKNNNSKNSRS